MNDDAVLTDTKCASDAELIDWLKASRDEHARSVTSVI
jgi:hypothetical protein